MSKYIVDIHGDIEGDYEIVRKYEEQEPMVEIDLYSVIKQKYIEREVLDKIRAEISTVYESLDGYDPNSLGAFVSKIDEIIDKYKAETEVEAGNDNSLKKP